MFIPIGDDIDRRTIPIVPVLLVVANVLVFAYQARVMMDAGPDPGDMMEASSDLYMDYGLVPKDLAEGRVLGLLTHMFMHGGTMHLLGNMIVLWAFACSLEAGLGSAMLLALYVAWGVGAGATHAGSELQSEIPLVGASGAIAGLMGAYTVAYGMNARIKTLFFILFRPFVVRIPAFMFGLFWICNQLWSASSDVEGMSGVGWFAHIGGFALGAATMWMLGNETDAELVKDKSGNLSFRKRESASPNAPAEAPTEGLLPESCPHCGSALGKEQAISPILAKCGNEGCARLVYPSRIPVTS